MRKSGLEFKISPMPEMEIFWQDKMNDAFPSHFHEHYVMGCLMRGERIYQQHGTSGRLDPFQLMIINPGQIHQCRASGKRPASWLALHFPARSICRLSNAHETAAPPFFHLPVISDNIALENFLNLAARPDPENAAALIRRILAIQEQAFVKKADKRGKYLSYSPTDAGMNHCEEKKESFFILAVRAMVADFISNPGQSINLAAMAEKAGMEKFSFLKKFKRLYGMSPCRYLEIIRLNLARKGLERGQSLSTCAQGFGYYDQSHMTRQFAANFGFSPGCLRKAANTQRGEI